MDLGKILALRTRRLALYVGTVLAICLIAMAFLNTRAQLAQDLQFVRFAGQAASELMVGNNLVGPALPQTASPEPVFPTIDELTSKLVERVDKESRRLTLTGELIENTWMASIAFAAFTIFVLLLISLQRRMIQEAFKPVQQMLRDLDAFETGDLSRRLPLVPLQELNVIAKGFNHLADTLESSIKKQQELSSKLIATRHQERMLLARDLHDDLGQALTAAAIEIDKAQLLSARPLPQAPPQPLPQPLNTELFDLDAISQHLDQARQSLRHLTAKLRQTPLDDAISPAAPSRDTDLASLLSFWQKQHAELQWHISEQLGTNIEKLHHQESQVIYRVLQESLTNTFKHAKPTTCIISFKVAEPMSLLIENDGVVGEFADRSRASGGFGLSGMQERVENMRGHLEFSQPSPNRWRVRLTWPRFTASR